VEKRNLGRSGLQVSAIGLGCNNFGARVEFETAKSVVHKALDLGITLLDTADTYGERGGSETALGKILGAERKNIVLASKFGMKMSDDGALQGGSRRYIMRAVEDSLKRLQTDWIDLYQLHEPDPLTPIEETLRALDDLVRQGKVRYLGCSNLKAWQVVEAQWTAKASGLEQFISCQDEYSLINRKIESELVPAMQSYNLGLLPYLPLASGLLTGKYVKDAPMPDGARMTKAKRFADRFLTEHNWKIAEQLGAFAAAHEQSLLNLAFSWLLAQPLVSSVIAGATSVKQIELNVATGNWKLSNEALAEIGNITK